MVLFSCSTKQTDELSSVKMVLSKDSQSIILKGLPHDILDQLKADSLSMLSWQKLMGIYKMPVYAHIMEPEKEQPGVYEVRDQQIIYKPDTAFIRGETYLCRFYGRNLISDPVKVILQRKLPDKVTFPEVTFYIK